MKYDTDKLEQYLRTETTQTTGLVEEENEISRQMCDDDIKEEISVIHQSGQKKKGEKFTWM